MHRSRTRVEAGDCNLGELFQKLVHRFEVGERPADELEVAERLLELGVVKFGIGSEVREEEQSGTETLFIESFDKQVVKGDPDSDKAVFGIVSHSVLAFRREGLELVSAWYNDIVALKSSFCPFYGAGHGLTAVGSRKRDTRTGGSIVRNIYARYGKRKGKCFEKSRKLFHNQ